MPETLIPQFSGAEAAAAQAQQAANTSEASVGLRPDGAESLLTLAETGDATPDQLTALREAATKIKTQTVYVETSRYDKNNTKAFEPITSYTFEAPDDKGDMQSQVLDSSLGERLIKFAKPEKPSFSSAHTKAGTPTSKQEAKAGETTLGEDADAILAKLQGSDTDATKPRATRRTKKAHAERPKAKPESTKPVDEPKRTKQTSAAPDKSPKPSQEKARTEKPKSAPKPSEAKPVDSKAAERARKLQTAKDWSEHYKRADNERWETKMRGNPNSDPEAMQAKWDAEDAAEAAAKAAKNMNHEWDEVADIVKLDKNGNAHRPNGAFMSRQNLEKLSEPGIQAQIRGGLAARNERVTAPRPAPEPYMSRSAAYQKQMALEGRTLGKQGSLGRMVGWKAPHKNWGEGTDMPARTVPLAASNQPKLSAENTSGNQVAHNLDARRPASITEELWNGLGDAEKQNLVDFEVQRKADIQANSSSNNTSGNNLPPLTGDQPRGIKRLMSWANAKLMILSAGGARNESANANKRDWIVGGVAGAMAVAGVVTIALSQRNGTHLDINMFPKGAGHAPDLPPVTPKVPHVAHETLASGHTVFGDLRDYAHNHGSHPSDEVLMRETSKILQENPKIGGWDGARHMAAGTHYDVQQAILNETVKLGKK